MYIFLFLINNINQYRIIILNIIHKIIQMLMLGTGISHNSSIPCNPPPCTWPHHTHTTTRRLLSSGHLPNPPKKTMQDDVEERIGHGNNTVIAIITST